MCNTSAPNPPSYVLSFTWQTSNADRICFGVATNDAQAGPLFDNLPPSGNSQDDFDYQVEFPCPSQSQTSTLTAVGDSGKVSETITVVNNGDTQ